MRVLFLNYEYPPLGGGAGNATSYILREYSKVPGLQVDLVTSSADEEYHEESLGENVKIYRLPIGKNKKNMHFQSQKDLLVYAWKAYFFSKKLIQKNDYDLTHSFFSVPCGFLSWKFKKQFGIPYIISLRGADVPGYSERFTFIYKIITPLIKTIWKNGTVISNSEGLKNLALETNPRQEIGVIYNGIDIEEFAPDGRGVENNKILCVSRLTQRKGIKYLIEAFSKLKDEKLELVIVGEGDEKDYLQKIAYELELGNRVKFLGLIPHEDLPKIYNNADVFVLPSMNEGMSNTMLEALASGLPIIATDTGGTKELVQDGENGFIIEMKSSKDIKEKIDKIMADNNLRQKMAHLSRKKAEMLSWRSVAKKYIDQYKVISNAK